MAWVLENVEAAAGVLRGGCGYTADIGLLPGDALGGLVERVQADAVVPGFMGEGPWVLGRWDGRPVLAQAGQARSPEQAAYAIRVMKALGVRTVLLAEPAWALSPSWAEGDLMSVTDHINALGDNPLIGPFDERLGPRFPDMSRTYSPELLERAARRRGVRLRRGVYLASRGAFPGSADDCRVYRRLGADAFGPGIVPAALAARQAGLRTVAVAVVARRDTAGSGAVGTMLETARRATPALSDIIHSFIQTSSGYSDYS